MVALAEVLALSSLALTPVAVIDPGVHVRWVATSELADPTPFLDGGEMLLTTGLNTAHWDAEWRHYTRRLAVSGIVALGFAVGLTHASVPVALVAAAGEAGLNLFSVPRSTPFIAISQAVAELLTAAERAALVSALAMQRDLTRAANRPDRVQAIVATLAAAVHGGAAVLSVRGEPLSMAGTTAGDPFADAPGQIDRLRPSGLRASLAEIGPDGSTVIQPLGLRGTPDRYLMVTTSGDVTGAQRSAITTAVALLSLDSESRSQRLEIDRRLRTGAVALILGGQASAAHTLLAIGSDRGAVDEFPGRICVLRAAGSPRQLENALEELDGADQAVVSALASPAVDQGSEIVNSELVTIVQADQVHVENVEAILLDAGLWVGSGGSVPLAEAASSDATAAQSLSQAGDFSRLVRWNDMATRGVTSVLNGPAATVFAADLLRPLADDRDELLETTRAFLANHGQRKTTAAQLGLHRNTLAHRIARIELLLGRSLAHPQTRVDLWLAIQIRDGSYFKA